MNIEELATEFIVEYITRSVCPFCCEVVGFDEWRGGGHREGTCTRQALIRSLYRSFKF
jgi:hypothetical protein